VRVARSERPATLSAMRRLWVFCVVASAAVACGASDVVVDGDAGNAGDGGVSQDGSVDGSFDAPRGDAVCGFCPSDAQDDVTGDAPDTRDGASADASRDAGADVALDAGLDARVDTGVDAGIDAGRDTGVDAGVDAGIDAGIDTGVDAGIDTGVDAGIDTGVDAPFDAPLDAPVFVDGGACNTLFNGGPAVPEVQVPLDVPTASGGTIALATYYLTEWQVFTGVGGAAGPTGNTRKTAFYFQPTLYMKVTADNGLGNENDNRMWSTQGTTLTSNQYCPSTDFLTSDYTVTGNLLVLVAGNAVLTFTKQ
jgi:hypothetical protein